MTSPQERLEGLIAFAKESAKLRATSPQHVSQHKQFSRFEEKFQGLPGLRLNVQEDVFDEVWLCLERLHESKSPIPESKLLGAWIDLSNNPHTEPKLKAFAERQELTDLGVLVDPAQSAEPSDCAETGSSADHAEALQKEPSPFVNLEDFADRESVEKLLKSYVETVWKPWAAYEKEVRKSIALYGELFMLTQQLQGNLVDSHLELVWGIGIAVQTLARGTLSYPLLTQLVEISLNERTMALEVRPHSSEPRLELAVYAAMDNPGVSNLVEAGKKFFHGTGGVLNPFEPSTFDPLLQTAVAMLSSSGTYWPSQTSRDDRSVPRATEHLVVTDTWVLFARPRTSSLFVQDLERFEHSLEAQKPVELPPAVVALVTDPSTTNEDPDLPTFRGVSMVSGYGESGGSAPKPQELYFPKPYNDEQVQIVQMLETYDGVVVQGPPGTGKTHTIANIICHYLAQGKRILVTSMKDPALAVLQDKLPESIRPLAISLLTSEVEGMKQFEYAVSKISAEVTSINRREYQLQIQQIDGQIDGLHRQLARIDRDIATWAQKNLTKFKLDAEEVLPVDAAEEVCRHRKEVAWFPDALTIVPEHCPQFGHDDILALRNARQTLSADIAYIEKRIPQLAEFPETPRLLQVHQDLSHLSELKAQESVGLVPSLASTAPEAVKDAMSALSQASNLRLLIQELAGTQQAWLPVLKQYIRQNPQNEILDIFLALRQEVIDALAQRRHYLSRPVSLPDRFEANPELIEAVTKLSQGKKPFGLSGFFGKGDQKKALDAVAIVSEKPQSAPDWEHVLGYVQSLQKVRSLIVRWNTLADEISLPRLEPLPDRLTAAGIAVDLYDKTVKCIAQEQAVAASLRRLLPTWNGAAARPLSVEVLVEAESILNHHLTRHRLGDTWAVREAFLKALSGCEGDITAKFKDFLQHRLGNSSVSDSELQSSWSSLMEELRRLHNLAPHLRTVPDVCRKIESSGATVWAERLRVEPAGAANDALLPDNWQETWRLVRLVTFVDSIDARHELKRLTKLRLELENDLSKRYQEAITKRTWLQLAEKATHSVRAALETYRNAIKKIGKGTGVRAGRYRQDARSAAEHANAAIPCWIMPHYRICESLPPSFGCFDLVIIDEASQSDLSALPAILRAKKILIVGDDKQVSPEGVGLAEEKVRNLMSRFLKNQVEIYRPQMSPERSIYDLFKVVFAKSSVMLREHFRCVGPIIEYSKREFYNHELKPLRLPRSSERLDPPLIDVFVQDGYRDGSVNLPEARFIVDEITKIVNDPAMAGRTIGIVSLLADDQALKIMQMLNEELGEELVTQFKITCGDARTFQGKERDIMFLSMVASPGNAHAQSGDATAQRFNVAASRARDRMYLVRSLHLDNLSPADRYRAGLMRHFQAPFSQSEGEIKDLREKCESPFEREIFDLLVVRGYRVTPQVAVSSYRIDMVVEGDNDARLAIECDGDRYHGPDQWDADMRRQRILERAGWQFWRCFASTFVLQREAVMQDLLEALKAHGVQPTTADSNVQSIHVGSRTVTAFASENTNRSEADEDTAAEAVTS